MKRPALPLYVSWSPATKKDSPWLFRLRNDPETRKQSFSSKPVTRAEHERWFRKKLLDENSQVWVARNAWGERNERVGHVRLDLSRHSVEVSITVDPKYRGRGWGILMLKSIPGTVHARSRTLHKAKIKMGNTASVIAFIRAGFSFVSITAGVYLLEKYREAEG